MKQLLLLLTSFFLFSPFQVFANETPPTESGALVDSFCRAENFSLDGNSEILINTGEEYKVTVASGSLEANQVTFELIRDNKRAELVSGLSYLRMFTQPGVVTLKAKVKAGECIQTISRDIHIYKSLYIFLGSPLTFLDNDFMELLKKKDILFKTITLPKNGPTLGSQDIYQLLLKRSHDLEKANILFLENDRSLSLLDGLSRLDKSVLGRKTGAKVQMYIISSTQFSLLSKIIAPYINKLSVKKIGIIEPSNFLDFVVKKGNDELSQVNFISFEKESKYFFSLNTLVQYLAYYGLDYSIIGILLSLSLALLVLNICKQIIGMNIFGIYYPLLLALCLSIMDIGFVSIFILIGLFSIGVNILIGRFIPFLFLAKRTLLITLYIIFSLIFLGIDSYFGFGFVQLDWFSNKAILVMIIVFIMITEKIFHEDVPLFSKRGIVYAFEFFLVVSICFFCLNTSLIQILLLSFPDIVFLLLIGNILVGQYSGLQLMEYVRFFPIIKKLHEEEE